MRMWNVDPKLMCRKHLLGEHVECHMMVGAILKKHSISGFIRNGLIEVHNIEKRHKELVLEMTRRGYNHRSELPGFKPWIEGTVNSSTNVIELARRCPECKKRMEKYNNVNENNSENKL
jgi:hypothetical protein